MFRRTKRQGALDAPESAVPATSVTPDEPAELTLLTEPDSDDAGGIVAGPDLAALPIVGITRRRMAGVIGVLVAIWIVVAFARQVGEASAASAKVVEIGESNGALRDEIYALERELDLIARQEYVEQQARGFGLGRGRETAFTLAPDAPPLPEDAPGSAAVRLGSEVTNVSPLERWLTLLFGPSD